MTPEEQAAALAKLREPFPADAIGYKPDITCPACRVIEDGTCDRHDVKLCRKCGHEITTEHDDLEFVGHAHVRERFLEADPLWSWEPMGVNGNGTPAIDDRGGLWIRLTIAGVTRVGYGDAGGMRGPNAVKEAMGDAFRNAGQSFGVALDLWKPRPGWPRRRRRRPAEPAPRPARMRDAATLRKEIRADAAQRGWKLPRIDAEFTSFIGGPGGHTFADAPADVLERFNTHVGQAKDD